MTKREGQGRSLGRMVTHGIDGKSMDWSLVDYSPWACKRVRHDWDKSKNNNTDECELRKKREMSAIKIEEITRKGSLLAPKAGASICAGRNIKCGFSAQVKMTQAGKAYKSEKEIYFLQERNWNKANIP